MTPDYHLLYVEPTLGADWLFVAARQYWDKFRPIVINDLELVRYLYAPKKRSVAVTALLRRDLAPKVIAEIRQRFPDVYFDPLVYERVEEMKMTLDARAKYNQRFGVPEGPTPTPLPPATSVLPAQ